MRDLACGAVLLMLFCASGVVAARAHIGAPRSNESPRPNKSCAAINIFAHNARVAGVMTIGGLITGGVLSLTSIISAGYGFGDTIGSAYVRGFSPRVLWRLTWPHFIIELPAFLAAGAAGFRGATLLGLLLRRSYREAVQCGFTSIKLFAAAILGLGVASWIECAVRLPI